MYEIINKKIYITPKLYDKDIEQVYIHLFYFSIGFLLSRSNIIITCLFDQGCTSYADLFQLFDCGCGGGGRRDELYQPKSPMTLL